MAGTNEDYMRRLRNDGRRDLLDKIDSGEISIYAATIAAGYRKKRSAASREEQLTYHWVRAGKKEKLRFIIRNLAVMAPMVDKVLKERAVLKAQKPSE